MDKLTTIGIDLAKEVIALCVMDQYGNMVEQRVLRREAFERCAAKLQPCIVAIEACSSAHQ